MRQSVKQCGRELGIGKDGWALREAQVGGDDQAGLLVELAHEVKQQCATDLAERQIAQFIKDDEMDVRHAVGELALLAVELFLLERVDEFHGGQKPDPPMVVDDGLHADRCGDVRLAGAGTVDEYAYSSPSRSPIPAQADHPFQVKPITDSSASRSRFRPKPITFRPLPESGLSAEGDPANAG